MENLEIIYENVPTSNLKHLLNNKLFLQKNSILRNNLYSKETKIEIVDDFKFEVYKNGICGYIAYSKYWFGIPIEKMLISLTFSKIDGNIELNFKPFDSNDFSKDEAIQNIFLINEAAQKLLRISGAQKINIGYEPASDKDMCLVELTINSKLEEYYDQLLNWLYI